MRAAMPGEVLTDEPADGVVRLTISNPQKRNALDHAILDGIAAATREHAGARCLVLTGSHGMFSAGYDIGDIPAEVFADRAEKLVAHPFTAALDALDGCDVPTVAALTGHTIGGGLELALVCDFRLAHDGILLGRNVDAATALGWGLVNRVVPESQLEETSLDLAAELAANAPLSVRGNKRVLRELLRAEGELDPDVERELIALREECFHSEDMQEGVRAFAEKRPPRWRGR